MNEQRRYLTILCTLLPFTALASGGEILELLFVELIVIVGSILTILLVKLNWKGRLIMLLFFIVTDFLKMWAFNDIRYRENKLMINWLTVCIPVVTTFLSYWASMSRFGKRKAS